MSTRAPSAGIPRLQDIAFLKIVAARVEAGSTYDQIRRALIEYMAAERERTQPSGNHAALRLARHDEHRYMNNATDALAELMRLGFVQPAQLPTTRKAAPIYAPRTFRLTPEGHLWVELIQADERRAYDELLRALWVTHSQLAGVLRLLREARFVVPTAAWGEVHQKHAGPEGREAYINFLASRTARAVSAGVTGWQATEDEIARAIRDHINGRMEADARRRRPDRYIRNQDFVGGCEDGLVSFAFGRAGLRVDYTTLEVLRRWTKQLGVANFSYHALSPPALRMWATADLEEDDQGRLIAIRRRTLGEWGDRVIEELQAAFEATRARHPRSDSFVPIYQVRAAVCLKLGLNDGVFNQAVIQFLDGARRPDAPFRMNCDSIEYGNTPPSETPLRVRDKSGREHTYRVMTLIPKS